jgi:hypothetical protein
MYLNISCNKASEEYQQQALPLVFSPHVLFDLFSSNVYHGQFVALSHTFSNE